MTLLNDIRFVAQNSTKTYTKEYKRAFDNVAKTNTFRVLICGEG